MQQIYKNLILLSNISSGKKTLIRNINYLLSFKKEILKKVEKYYKIYGFDMDYEGEHRSYNNEADAFKHTFMQAHMK